MWFKCPNDGKHYNSDSIYQFKTNENGDDTYSVQFLPAGAETFVGYDSTTYPTEAEADAAIVGILGSFVSE